MYKVNTQYGRTAPTTRILTMKVLALIVRTVCLLTTSSSAQDTKVDFMQATRARDASLEVHRNIMQRLFGMNVSYSGALLPKPRLRRLPMVVEERPRSQPFDNISIHPLTGRAEGVTLLSINF